MQRWLTSHTAALAIAVAAVLVRLAFVVWAPRELSGDGQHYHMSAFALYSGSGYTELDGSPSVRWMPGWPYFLAALYSVFGVQPSAGMIANALFDGATAGLLVLLGGRLLSPRIGMIAGGVYALWPGNVFYTATLMTEPIFNWLFVSCLAALCWAQLPGDEHRSARRRRAGALAAGVCLGSMALVKAEPLVLTPVLVWFVWRTSASAPAFLGTAALVIASALLLLAPWIYRNHQAFGRLMVTTATGGANAWLGNHEGASGTQDIVEMRAFMARNRRENTAETLFAASRTGWREAADFARERPGEALAIVVDKLRHTYGSDGHGARLVRGVGVGRVGFVSESARAGLERLADAYWLGVVGLVVIGLTRVPGWPPETRILLLGLPLCWVAVHLVFLGGPRFHVPESPLYALIAACGLDRVLDFWRKR